MVTRTFIPGSQWLYIKLYTGQKSADEILVQTIHPYVKTLLEEKLITKFFFIRYSDPEFHIRLRLHIERPENYGEVFQRLYQFFQPCVENKLIYKITCDTYNREIERYGAHTIELLEDMFYVDSEYAIRLLQRLSDISSDERDIMRWKLSMVLLDDMMTGFGYDVRDKMDIMGRSAARFKQEFGFTNHAYTKQLNDKYREASKDVAMLLQRKNMEDYQDLLTSRSQQIEAIADKIKNVETSGVAEVVTADLLSSILHMTMNRWFHAKNRLHELVIYDFLSRYFESSVARNRSTKEESPRKS